jgi:hypothetical protein
VIKYCLDTFGWVTGCLPFGKGLLQWGAYTSSGSDTGTALYTPVIVSRLKDSGGEFVDAQCQWERNHNGKRSINPNAHIIRDGSSTSLSLL